MNALPLTAMKMPFQLSIHALSQDISYRTSGVDLLFILEGTLQIENQTSKLQEVLVKSDVAMLPPAEVYQLKPSNGLVILSIKIEPRFLTSAFYSHYPFILCRSTENDPPDMLQLRKVLSQLACLSYSDDYSTRTFLLYSQIYRVLDLMYKHYENTAAELPPGNKPKKHEQHLAKIKAYILQNYSMPVTLNEIADYLYMTPQYLSKFIKKHLGVGFYEYLNSIRLENAVHELTHTQDTITNIVFRNGFPNLSSFNKVFKEKYNTSPQKYRKDTLSAKPEQAVEIHDFTTVEFDRIKNQFSSYINISEFSDNISDRSRLDIEASASRHTPWSHPWSQVMNMGYITDLTQSDFRAQISMLQRDMNFKYARFQGIFSENLNLDVNNPSSYNFYNIDKIIDYLYSMGLLPFIEIGNKPKKIDNHRDTEIFYLYNAMNGGFGSVSNIKTIFISFIKHCINRYGASEVEKWRFELWVEHTGEAIYSEDKIDEYILLFKDLFVALKAILPNAHLGGPGFNISSDVDALKKIITSLSKDQITPDFISLYVFPFVLTHRHDANTQNAAAAGSPQTESIRNTSPLLIMDNVEFRERSEKVIKSIRQCNSAIDEFFVSEWNLDFVSRNFLNDSCFKAAFIINNVLNNFGDLHSAYWLMSDISSEYRESDGILFGGTGLISRNGIRKPAYFAFSFLSKLGHNLIQKGDGYIITSRSSNEYEVLVYNYKFLNDYYRMNFTHHFDVFKMNHLFEDLHELEVSVKLTDVKSGKYRVRQYMLNSDHGSVLDEWLRLNTIKNMRQSDISYLDNICMPKRFIYSQDCEDELTIKCLLKPNEINLFVIKTEL